MRWVLLALALTGCASHSNAMHMRERLIVENEHAERVTVSIGMTSSTSFPVGKVDPLRTRSFALPERWEEYTLVIVPFGAKYIIGQQSWTHRLHLFSQDDCIKVRVAPNLGASSLMAC